MKEKIKIFLPILIILITSGIFYAGNNVVKTYGECLEYGSMAYYDSFTNTCKCMSGYVFGKFLGSDYCISKDQWCRDKYGYNAMSDYLSGCKCISGYVFGQDIFGNTSCVSADQLCRDQYGVMARYNSLYDKCECFIGYVFGNDILGRTQCVSEDDWCRDKYGFNSKYNSLSDKCECKSGYELTLKSGGGLECVSCFSKYGLHSSYNYLSDKCECDSDYTLDDNNQCVEKQNNVYFLLKELDLNNRKAVVKSDYDYREYLIEYGYGCYDFTIERYLNKKIVINLGTDLNLDRWDKIVLQNDSVTCDVTNVERVFGTSGICDSGYILKDNRCSKINCPQNSTIVVNQCICNAGYVVSGDTCITHTQNCQNQHGINSYGDKNLCYCNTGYEWNSSKTNCVKIEKKEEPKPSNDISKNEVEDKAPTIAGNQQSQNKQESKGFFKSASIFLANISSAIKNFFGRLFK